MKPEVSLSVVLVLSRNIKCWPYWTPPPSFGVSVVVNGRWFVCGMWEGGPGLGRGKRSHRLSLGPHLMDKG